MWYKGLTSTQQSNGIGWCNTNNVSYEVWSGDATQVRVIRPNGAQQTLMETVMGLAGIIGSVVGALLGGGSQLR